MPENDRPHRSYLSTIFGCWCPRCREGKLFRNNVSLRLKKNMEMYERCPVCGQVTDIEVGFYYGTGYVSYLIGIVITVISFLIWFVTIGFSFKDSRRPGTPAAVLPKQVSDGVKAARLDALQALLNAQTKAFDQSCVGRALDVLFERPGRYDGQLVGRSPYMQAMFVEAPSHVLGTIQRVRVTAAPANSLAAELVTDGPAPTRVESPLVEATA